MSSTEGPPWLALDDAGCATITLNRPRHLNRLHREDLLALQSHLAQLAQDTTLRVVVQMCIRDRCWARSAGAFLPARRP